MWKDSTSKKEIETALNTKISDEIYKNLIDKYESSFSTPTLIIYGKNADGELIGKYAGTLMYNLAKNGGYYRGSICFTRLESSREVLSNMID